MTGPYLCSDKQRGRIPADFSRGKQFFSTPLHQRVLWDSPKPTVSSDSGDKSAWMVKPTGPLRLIARLSISEAWSIGYIGQYWERNVDTLLWGGGGVKNFEGDWKVGGELSVLERMTHFFFHYTLEDQLAYHPPVVKRARVIYYSIWIFSHTKQRHQRPDRIRGPCGWPIGGFVSERIEC